MGLHWLKGDLSYPSKRISLAFAAVILVAFILPLGLYLGNWNFPLWIGFIVWAEYFALGAKVDTWKLIIPSIPFGAGVAAAWCSSAVVLSTVLAPLWGPVTGLYVAFVISGILWFPILIYGLGWTHAWAAGSLAVFNGFTLQLALYFTGALPTFGPMGNPYWIIWWSCFWAIAMAYVGWFIGWFHVVLTFPKRSNKE